MVCLKHVGIQTQVRDRLKISVKTLSSWSAHARSTRSRNPSVPVALNVDLSKGPTHISYRVLSHSHLEQLMLSFMLQFYLLQSSIEVI